MIASLLLQAAISSLPIIDHGKSISVVPINASVVMCASPSALPLARLAARSLDHDGPDYGLDALMDAGGCITAMNTAPMSADFQEDVAWAGALQPPTMLHGVIRVVRVRIDFSLPGFKGLEGYKYVAAEDLRP